MTRGARHALLGVAALAASGAAFATIFPGQALVSGAGRTDAVRFSFQTRGISEFTKQPVEGQAVFKWTVRPVGSLELRVTCLRIDGNTAMIGGEAVKTSGPRLAPVRVSGALFAAQDNATVGQADRISRVRLLRQAPSACPAPDTFVLRYPLREGNIVVRRSIRERHSAGATR